MIKKCETGGITYEVCDCFLQYSNFKHDLIEYKWLCCNKNYQQNADKKLKEQSFKFSNHDNSEFFFSLLQKKVFILMNI